MTIKKVLTTKKLRRGTHASARRGPLPDLSPDSAPAAAPDVGDCGAAVATPPAVVVVAAASPNATTTAPTLETFFAVPT
ncbi:MAG: hypothetical protein WBB07_07235 [Mycobacterium sp.]